jgi:tetratricopeptide (TPR) repeat protein
MKIGAKFVGLAVLLFINLWAAGSVWADAAQDAYNRGTNLLNSGRYREAIPYFDKAIRLNPRYVEAYNNRGNAYRDLGQYQRAIQDYDEAIRLNPRLVHPYYNRGNAYSSLRQHQRAIQDYDEAIRLNPRLAAAYIQRGIAYADLGQHQRAIQDYNEAIRLNPRYVEAYNNRGNAYRDLRQHQRAIQDYDEAIRLNPRFAPAYANRGLAQLYLHKDAEAERDFKKAFELDPSLKRTFEPLIKQAKAKSETSAAGKQPPQSTLTPEDSQEMARLVERISQSYKGAFRVTGDFVVNNRVVEKGQLIKGYSMALDKDFTLVRRYLSCDLPSVYDSVASARKSGKDWMQNWAENCDKERQGVKWKAGLGRLPLSRIRRQKESYYSGKDLSISFEYNDCNERNECEMAALWLPCKNHQACAQMAADLKKLVEIARKYGGGKNQ